jgi:hypothetical protein
MPRRCTCEELFDLLDQDPGLRLAGPAAQMAFLHIMRLAARMGSPGFLPLGSPMGSPIRNLSELASLLPMQETELQTHIDTLIGRGVLVREEAGLACPALRRSPRKALTAQENGRLGGRPRAGETPEQARARRQGRPVLVENPAETHAEPNSETHPRARADRVDSNTSSKTKTLSETPPTGKEGVKERGVWGENHPGGGRGQNPGTEPNSAEPDNALVLQTGDRVLEAAGIDPVRWQGNYREVRGWLSAGWTPDQIVAAIGRIAQVPGYQPPYSLRYFSRACFADRSPPPAGGKEPETIEIDMTAIPGYAEWRVAADKFRENGFYGDVPYMPPEVSAAVRLAESYRAKGARVRVNFR